MLEISGHTILVVSELSPAPSLLVCTMNTGWKRLQHEKRAKVAQRMLFAEHNGHGRNCEQAKCRSPRSEFSVHAGARRL